jgi:hypothetical protein
MTRGFSRIEPASVLAVFAALIARLLPAARGAHEAARPTRFVTNVVGRPWQHQGDAHQVIACFCTSVTSPSCRKPESAQNHCATPRSEAMFTGSRSDRGCGNTILD